MPTVLREEGFRVYFWSREPNEPAHVHVDRAGATAKDLSTVLSLVRRHRLSCLEAWDGFFGSGGNR